MPSPSRYGRRPSTPSAVVESPCSRALASPSDAGSMPTIHTGRIQRLRSALYIRSVPMLPEPISARFTFPRRSPPYVLAAISPPCRPRLHNLRDDVPGSSHEYRYFRFDNRIEIFRDGGSIDELTQPVRHDTRTDSKHELHLHFRHWHHRGIRERKRRAHFRTNRLYEMFSDKAQPTRVHARVFQAREHEQAYPLVIQDRTGVTLVYVTQARFDRFVAIVDHGLPVRIPAPDEYLLVNALDKQLFGREVLEQQRLPDAEMLGQAASVAGETHFREILHGTGNDAGFAFLRRQTLGARARSRRRLWRVGVCFREPPSRRLRSLGNLSI